MFARSPDTDEQSCVGNIIKYINYVICDRWFRNLTVVLRPYYFSLFFSFYFNGTGSRPRKPFNNYISLKSCSYKGKTEEDILRMIKSLGHRRVKSLFVELPMEGTE